MERVRSADLGDLRTACELAHAAGEAGGLLVLLLDALGHHLGVVGELQDDRVAGRHRALTADHDGVLEDLLQQPGRLRLHRALAGDDPAQEPAGPVDADEADDLVAALAVGELDGNLRAQLPAERALDLLDDAALLGDARADLLADLAPDALLLGRGEWAEALLSAVEAGTIPPAQIDAAGRSRLIESENGEIKERAEKLFAAASNPNREKVLSEWKSVVDMEGDARRGKQSFATTCIACHVAEGQGNAIGPDLTAISDRSRNALLVAILDPNRAVEDKFVTWNVKTNAGASHLGLVANESANDFTLRGPDGSELKILRSDIESMSSVGISLMPEGLEAAMNMRDLADLIQFVQNFKWND